MKTIEFETRAKNGVIKIPSKYKHLSNAEVKVIMLKKKSRLRPVSKKRETIRKLFKLIQEKRIFSKIKDPVKWQARLRNEW